MANYPAISPISAHGLIASGTDLFAAALTAARAWDAAKNPKGAQG